MALPATISVSLNFSSGATFGNPFIIGRDGDREEVIRKYDDYARTNIELLKAIAQLPKDAVLGCYCFPKKCHGDIIIELWKQYCQF
jgi:hypothetical protein